MNPPTLHLYYFWEGYTVDAQGNLIIKSGTSIVVYKVSQPSTNTIRFVNDNVEWFEFNNNPKQATQTLLSSFNTQTLTANFKIRTNGTISGGNDFDFYESSATSATYTVLDNGNIAMSVNGVTIEYSVEAPTSNTLQFTLVTTTNSSYSSYLGQTFLF
jgi:hypothetical protein